MATNTRVSAAGVNAACDAIVDLLDAGGAGTLKIYSGTQPDSPDTAITDQTLLATLTLSAPAFGAAAGGVATADTITADSSADATNTASWFRASSGAGDAVIDGSVGTSGADLNMDSVSFVAGATISVSSWTFTVPKNA